MIRTLMFRIIHRQLFNSQSVLTALTVCLALLVFLVQTSCDLDNARVRQVEHTYGTQHGFIFNCSSQLLTFLSQDSDVQALGNISLLGVLSNDESAVSGTVSLGAFDDQARQMACLELQNGRWPQNQTEIVLEEKALLLLRLRAQVGDTISLSLTRPTAYGTGETITASWPFHLVGILKNYAYMQYHPSPSLAIQSDLPGAIIGTGNDANLSALSVTASIRLRDKTPYIPFFRAITDRFSLTLDQYYLNTALYPPDAPLAIVDNDYQKNLSSYFYQAENAIGYDDQRSQTRMILNLIIGFLIVLTIFTIITTLLIYHKKQQTTGLVLRLAGASPRQVATFLSLQVAFYLLLLLPAGLVLGGLAALIISILLLTNQVPYYQFAVHGGQLMLVLLAFVLIVSVASAASCLRDLKNQPLAVGQQVRNKVRKPGKNRPERLIRRPILFWSVISFQENRLALSGVLFTLVLCFSAILISSFLVVQLQQTNRRVYQYDAVITNTALPYVTSSISNFYIPLDYRFGFERNDLKTIEVLHELKTIYTLNRYAVNLLGSETTESIDRLNSLNFQDIEYANSDLIDMINQDKVSYGYQASDRIYTGSMIGAGQTLLADLSAYVRDGQIDAGQLDTGKSVILVSRTGQTVFQVGDQLTLTQIIYAQYDQQPEDWTRKDVIVRIAAIIDLSKAVDAFPNLFGSVNTLVWGERAISIFGIDSKITGLYMTLNNPFQDQALQLEIRRLSVLYPGSEVYLKSEADRQTTISNNILLGSAYGILLILVCFAFFSLYSFSQSLISRNRHVIGALRAGGFSYDLMRRLKLFESIQLIGLAFILAHFLSIGAMLAMLPWQNYNSFIREVIVILNSYPLSGAIVSLPTLILAAWFFQLLPIRAIYRLSVCDLIREY
ncbi:MAG: ABC transporter permease [Clostridiaceae bacterium]|nr:ABC transporter permease [Clostridiaceae bacterium]